VRNSFLFLRIYIKEKKTYFKQCFYSDIPNRKYFIALFLKIKSVNIEILAMLCYNAEATSCVAMEISLIMTYDAIWFWFNSSLLTNSEINRQ